MIWLARFMAAAAVTFWAASYIWAKTALTWLHPIAASEVRYVISAVVLLAIAIPIGGLVAALRDNWRRYIVLGVVGITFFQALLFIALDYTTAVNASVIMALTPVLTMAGAAVFLGEPFGVRAGIGMVISVAGALLAVLGDSPNGFAGLTLDRGEPLALLGAGCMAFYTVASRRLMPTKEKTLINTALVVGFGMVFLLPLSAFTEAPRTLPTWPVVVALTGLTLGSTVLGYLFWTHAIKVLGVSEPNILYNFIPVLTMIMASLQGTPPHTEQVIGALLVVAGVTLSIAPLGRGGTRPAGQTSAVTHH